MSIDYVLGRLLETRYLVRLPFTLLPPIRPMLWSTVVCRLDDIPAAVRVPVRLVVITVLRSAAIDVTAVRLLSLVGTWVLTAATCRIREALVVICVVCLLFKKFRVRSRLSLAQPLCTRMVSAPCLSVLVVSVAIWVRCLLRISVMSVFGVGWLTVTQLHLIQLPVARLWANVTCIRCTGDGLDYGTLSTLMAVMLVVLKVGRVTAADPLLP